ncbi:MAG: hypothetical protein V1898_04640 [Patescibacteria group bacterium]
MKKKKQPKIAIGTTIGAIVAATGAVLFFTKTKAGEQTAKKIKEYATHLGKEISHKVTEIKDISQIKYEKIVDDIVDEYSKKKKIATTTTKAIKKDLKAHWKEVKKELKKK